MNEKKENANTFKSAVFYKDKVESRVMIGKSATTNRKTSDDKRKTELSGKSLGSNKNSRVIADTDKNMGHSLNQNSTMEKMNQKVDRIKRRVTPRKTGKEVAKNVARLSR